MIDAFKYHVIFLLPFVYLLWKNAYSELLPFLLFYILQLSILLTKFLICTYFIAVYIFHFHFLNKDCSEQGNDTAEIYFTDKD